MNCLLKCLGLDYKINFRSLFICYNIFIKISIRLFYLVYVWIQLINICVFFFWKCVFSSSGYCSMGHVYCLQEPQTSFFNKTFIKNESHNTIHTFKNYFVTVFSIFSKINGIQIHFQFLSMVLSATKNYISYISYFQMDSKYLFGQRPRFCVSRFFFFLFFF